jgi:type III secretion protein J
LATQIRPASASIFIKYRRDADLEALAPPIKNLIMRSIEGLQYENISLTFVPADDFSRTASRQASVSSSDRQERVMQATLGGGGLVVVLLLCGAFGIWTRYGRRASFRAAALTGESRAGVSAPHVR